MSCRTRSFRPKQSFIRWKRLLCPKEVFQPKFRFLPYFSFFQGPYFVFSVSTKKLFRLTTRLKEFYRMVNRKSIILLGRCTQRSVWKVKSVTAARHKRERSKGPLPSRERDQFPPFTQVVLANLVQDGPIILYWLDVVEDGPRKAFKMKCKYSERERDLKQFAERIINLQRE